ncbi:hypothetical protein [Erythrobacter ani]|uniref:Uncharacterized protein n=1 Tax=Erythrobacter ani TaxID=2827235 RepID=A0ABS6SI42_9SPHN|nr:hypothetical protein [Erythrobacter ani]MBV7264678.1 hypothetical protein [Erythrobacter ani]
MQTHFDIAALRSDPALQRRVRSRMSRAADEWRDQGIVQTIAAELQGYGSGCDLSDCQSLGELTTERAVATSFADAWLKPMLHALQDEPLAEVQHRYRCSDGLTSVQLMQSGEATLSLLAYERRDQSGPEEPQTALFSDRESREIVLSGSARSVLHRRENGTSAESKIATIHADWREGCVIVMTGLHETRQVLDVRGSLVLLQLSRTPRRPRSSREFRLADGALMRSVSGDKSASEKQMALAVIGAMHHGLALDLMADRARDQNEDADVRWEAVRQTLALNTQRGMDLLAELRASPRDQLARPAADLEQHLFHTKPKLEEFSCRI